MLLINAVSLVLTTTITQCSLMSFTGDSITSCDMLLLNGLPESLIWIINANLLKLERGLFVPWSNARLNFSINLFFLFHKYSQSAIKCILKVSLNLFSYKNMATCISCGDFNRYLSHASLVMFVCGFVLFKTFS